MKQKEVLLMISRYQGLFLMQVNAVFTIEVLLSGTTSLLKKKIGQISGIVLFFIFFLLKPNSILGVITIDN